MRFTAAAFKHAEALLAELLRSTFAADSVVSHYFRQHRELGHADRAFVAESVYSVLRHKRSLAARCADDVTSRRLLLADLACVQGLNRRQLDTVLREYRHHGVGLILCGAGSRVRLQLRRAGIHRREQQLAYVHDLEQARGKALRWLGEKTEPALAGAV